MAERRTVTMVTPGGIFTTPPGCLEALPTPHYSVETGSVAVFEDKLQTNYLNAIPKIEAQTFKFLDEGIDPPAIGTVVTVNIVTVYTFGKGTDKKTRTVTYDAFVQDVNPDTVTANGQRVAAIAIELLPVGGGDGTKQHGTVS